MTHDEQGSRLQWRWFPPPGAAGPPWVSALQRMRGVVLYEGGRRPFFRCPDGTLLDDDPLDVLAHHLIAFAAGEPVGAVRLLAGEEAVHGGAVRALVGDARFAGILEAVGMPPPRMGEVGRLVVDSAHRSRGLGMSLVAGTWAICRSLEILTVLATVGTRDGQDRMLLKTGAQPVPGFAPIPSERLADEVRLLWFPVPRPAAGFERWVTRMAATLELDPPATFPVPHPRAGEAREGPAGALMPEPASTAVLPSPR